MGNEATLRTFVRILCERKLVSLAEAVVSNSQKPPKRISIFSKYLQKFYMEKFSHPACNQWPSLLKEFELPSVYVDLRFHVVPLNIVKGIPSKHMEIELKDVFKQPPENRFIILFEGIAGSGKTTLAWYACKEWAHGRLLQQFDLVIHVQVNDPRLQNADSLQDLIPDRCREARDEIAQAITDSKGKGACLFLEGLDEASKSLRNFLTSKLLHNSELCHLSIIITSRPDSRLLIELQKMLTSRIVIDGFSNEKLDDFLDSSMQNDKEKKDEVNKMFKLNPRFHALCTLPINAVVVIFLTQCFGDELPVTQTGLFNLLICHICVRHVQLRSNNTEILEIQQLPHDLPSDIQESFEKLCLLAYTASMERKRALSASDLKQAGFNDAADNKLGILHIHQKKSMYGLAKNYSFPHYALQQFLAAIHLSHQTDMEQKSCIEHIMSQDPLDEVLPFYAGLTKLASSKSRAVLLKVLKSSLDDGSIAEELEKHPTAPKDPRRRALALFKCLYECQKDDLMAEANLQSECETDDIIR